MTNDTDPVVKSFRLVGLHGYKNIRLEFDGKVKIVIAENGAGKTIFLSALNAFLTRNFLRLATIQFERLECEISGHSGPIVLNRSQLPAISDGLDTSFHEFAKYSNAEVGDIREEVLRYEGYDFDEVPIFQTVYTRSPWSREEMEERLRAMRKKLEQLQSDEMKLVNSAIKDCLENIEVLYLPTYRRVELAKSRRGNRRRVLRDPWVQKLSRGEFREVPPLMPDINYGLADVEERLGDLTESIQRQSNIGFREISAKIIDDLLAGQFASRHRQNDSLPEIGALRRFFYRIEQLPSYVGQPKDTPSEQRIDAIARLYESRQIEEQYNEPLRYFLGELSKVVNQTKELESNIENFVKISNEYLGRSGDAKQLQYDATEMIVKVINLWTQSEIKFNDLSSGEKQVISLFAHLYLYQKQKIVLIDEPELSLSIDWQRNLLPDVTRAPNCKQLLAITHSPFIFENELDPYASPLDIERIRSGETSL